MDQNNNKKSNPYAKYESNNKSNQLCLSLLEGEALQTKNRDYFSVISCTQTSAEGPGRSISVKAKLEDLLALKYALDFVNKGKPEKARHFSISDSDNKNYKNLTVREFVGKDGEKFPLLVFKESDGFELQHGLEPTRALSLVYVLGKWVGSRLSLAFDLDKKKTNPASEAGLTENGF